MTYIKKMTMNGFKSFAHHTELILGNNFNCVLGPNGSGKSNVMDALCFVLGKGSAKGLRAEKSSNLIYNGGKTKTPAKQGEVSIFFDNSKKTFPTKEDEVKITRIVRHTGQSIYKINDKTRTRQQILELLSIANINPDGFNIILQGDIVSFTQMSPDERKKIIEEISGISVYDEKKKKAENELNKVEDRLTQAELILGERKTYLDGLKEEKEQAEKYKNTKDKLDRSQATLLNLKITDKNTQLEKINNNLSNFKTTVEKFGAQYKETTNEVSKRKLEQDNINKEIEAKGEKEQVERHKEVETLKIDIEKGKTRIESCEGELGRLSERKAGLTKNLEEIKLKIEKSNINKTDITKLKEKKENELTLIIKKITQYRKDNKLDDAGDIEKKIEELDKEIEIQQIEISKIREQQQNSTRKKDQLEFQIQSIDEKVLKVKEVEKEYKDDIIALKRQREELKKTTLQLSKALDENSSFTDQINHAKIKLDSTREKLTELTAKNNLIKHSNAGGMAIQKIMENKSQFGDVYGTISELGNVDSKFSQALEVAAGPRLKGIVVQDDRVAANCIKFLKQNKLGSATFIPMNKIRAPTDSPNSDKLVKSSGSHGFATDLVDYDPKFNKVFKYVFGSTIIVDNIDSARKIGVGNIRMSTMTGDLVELSGAMSGGYKDKKSKGGFGEKQLIKDLRECERKEGDYQGIISKLETSRTKNEEEITRLREFKAELEGEIIKKEKSLHLDSNDMKASIKVKDEFIKELKDVDAKIMQINFKISSINTELAKFKMQKQKLREEIGELRNPRKLAELNAFETKKDELKEEILKVTSELKNIEVQITTIFAPEEENTTKILKQHDKEELDFSEEMRLLKENIKTQKIELKEKQEKEKVFMEQFKTLFDRRKVLEKEEHELELKLKDIENKIKEQEIKNNNNTIEAARVKAELYGLNEEYKKYNGIEHLAHTKQTLYENIKRCEIQIEAMGNINLKSLEIYDKVLKEYLILEEKKESLKTEKEDVIMMMNEIETKKKSLFMENFESLNNIFKDFFSRLSTKGEAFLELEAPDDPLSKGVLIKVCITGKKYLDIRSLSGGEKTMTALAFIFTIQEHNPASFYVLDEVDAALDKKNAEKLADLVKEYSDRAQFLLISHNDGVISKADILYGVSMNEHGMSKIVSLKI